MIESGLSLESLQQWLDRYVAAWRTYDPGLIGDLFAEEAEYRFHPWGSPVHGRDAIVDAWLSPDGDGAKRDAPGTFDCLYEAFAVDGHRAVALGWTKYWTDASRSTLKITYHNVFVLEFDGDHRCSSFLEQFMVRPAELPEVPRLRT